MSIQADKTDAPRWDGAMPVETSEEKQLDQVADEAAEKAGETE